MPILSLPEVTVNFVSLLVEIGSERRAVKRRADYCLFGCEQ